MIKRFILLMSICLSLTSCDSSHNSNSEDSNNSDNISEGEAYFYQNVYPVFKSSCNECHSESSSRV